MDVQLHGEVSAAPFSRETLARGDGSETPYTATTWNMRTAPVASLRSPSICLEAVMKL